VDTLVELIGVKKVYKGGAAQPALDAVSLRIERGEFVAIMGPSGSGKSTMLNLIAGLDRPTTGKVIVDGIDITKLGESGLAKYRRQRLGFVFQFFYLLDSLTVLDNILMPAQLAGSRGRKAGQRARELLSEMGISQKTNQYPARLSGGERQRVAIARALINTPILLLADEPTGALDSRNGEDVMEQLVELNRAGQTIIQVTHDHNLAARYAGRVIFLRDGHVVDDTVIAPTALAHVDGIVRLRAEEAAS
jgi:putative ABC transport system ATP-binding protein